MDAAIVAALAGCSGGSKIAAEPSAAATTEVAGLPAASPAPAPPPAAPRAGTVRVDPEPFSDRVRVTGMRSGRGARPRLTGRLADVADVSELVVLELRADLYDRRGSAGGHGHAGLRRVRRGGAARRAAGLRGPGVAADASAVAPS